MSKPTYTVAPIQADAAKLLARLEDGYQKIEAAEQAGRDTTFMTEFWIGLLHQYEAIVTELHRTATTQKGMFDE